MASDLAAAGMLIERVARSGASLSKGGPSMIAVASSRGGRIPATKRLKDPWPGRCYRRAGVTHAVRDLPRGKARPSGAEPAKR